ncbi:hypothetical protein PR048_012859 [Dryococelus australis]|uniref:Uncharacterized protein n=1 Tax=Dryococelus australis TaxID=614101 RepID=A0ABQ9HQL7_9NEOP|nr:hypothetical protein PR048_012859 [Dryococelus australis]
MCHYNQQSEKHKTNGLPVGSKAQTHAVLGLSVNNMTIPPPESMCAEINKIRIATLPTTQDTLGTIARQLSIRASVIISYQQLPVTRNFTTTTEDPVVTAATCYWIPPESAILSQTDYSHTLLHTMDYHHISSMSLSETHCQSVNKVHKLSMKENNINYAEICKDEWGQTVIDRLQHISNLVAADRVQSTMSVEEALENMYLYLEQNIMSIFFYDLMNQLKGDYHPDVKTVKAKLSQKYSEDILITEGYKLLTDTWYNNKKSDHKEE